MNFKHGKKFQLVIVIITVIALSCAQKDEESKYQFVYYPKVNMYYNEAAGQFIYSIDSARTWNTIDETSPEPPATLGTGQIIKTDNKQVWNDNEQHRSQFKGILINVPKEDPDVASGITEVKEKKVIKKSVSKAPKKEPEKKGINKFLNKIFGKKKNRD